MKEIQFHDISQRYPNAIKSIQDTVIRKIYSNFEFQYFHFNSDIQNDQKENDNGNKNIIKNSLYYYLHIIYLMQPSQILMQIFVLNHNALLSRKLT